MIRRLFAALAFVLLLPYSVHAQTAAGDVPPQGSSQNVQAVVTEVEKDWTVNGKRQMIFDAKTQDGATYRVDTTQGYVEGLRYDVKEGTRVLLEVNSGDDGTQAYLADVVRTDGLLVIFLAFCLLTVAVGYWRGFAALIGLGLTLGVLFGFVFPRILAGDNPLLITAAGGVVILAVNMHLSHGFSRRTFVAFLSTLGGFFLALIASVAFVRLAHLSGLASEEANFLFWRFGSSTYPQGILLAAILLGALGVLDDITVTQTETVAELKHADPSLSAKELYVRAMRVGRHHIASTVNTLILAYVGASMPLFLLFLSTPGMTFTQFLNTEQVAEEIVRTLAGTAALVLTVPLSTWLAALVVRAKDGHGAGHGHTHSGA